MPTGAKLKKRIDPSAIVRLPRMKQGIHHGLSEALAVDAA
jgi:hypothetical protein